MIYLFTFFKINCFNVCNVTVWSKLLGSVYIWSYRPVKVCIVVVCMCIWSLNMLLKLIVRSLSELVYFVLSIIYILLIVTSFVSSDESAISREVAEDEFNAVSFIFISVKYILRNLIWICFQSLPLGTPTNFGLESHSMLSSLPQPVSKPSRSMSTSSIGSLGEPLTPGGSYPKAPGSERSERSSSREEDHQVSCCYLCRIVC